jgi:hypothetical protein
VTGFPETIVSQKKAQLNIAEEDCCGEAVENASWHLIRVEKLWIGFLRASPYIRGEASRKI